MVPVGTRPDHGDEGAAVPGRHGTGGTIPRMVGLSGTVSICNNITKTEKKFRKNTQNLGINNENSC
jgi:hypothetical protein